MTDYLTVVDVLAIHTDQVERYGGGHGIRDPGLLEAALYRPQTGYYQDVIAEAAALWESLSQNHPFIDVTNARRSPVLLPFYSLMAFVSMHLQGKPGNFLKSIMKREI